MLPDNKKNMVLENNLNNVQEKDGIKYINNEKASSISKETTRGKEHLEMDQYYKISKHMIC